MVAAISATASTTTSHPNPKTSSQEGTTTTTNRSSNPTRPPLLPSERDNGLTSSSRRPKSKEITSRYMSSANYSFSSSSSSSSSSSRRCPSPLTSTSTTTSTPLPVLKRSQSVERRRPVTPRPTTPLPDSRPNNASQVSTASKILFTSTRSLSVSFQGESFSLPISKTKATPPPNLSNARKSTPERRRTTPMREKVGGERDQVENSKPSDQHRWPGRTRQVNPLTRSMDCTVEKKKIFGSGVLVQGLHQSMIDESRRASFDGRLHTNSSNAELLKSVQVAIDDSNSANGSAVPSDLTASDSDSVSSGSNSGVQECGAVIKGRGLSRGISVPARFWQETNSRLRRLQDPGSPLSSTTTGSRGMAQPKLIPARKSLSDSPIASPRTVPISRTMSSPLRGPVRPASPSKVMTPSTSSPSRGMLSPARMRNAVGGTMSNQSINTPSILSFAADVRRGKMGETRIVDAHLLRLLYNRNLQWRFVNARSDAALLVQRITAEKNLYNAWVTMSELRDSVTVKRIKLQLRRQNLKLTSILKGQMTYLEEWAVLDRDHSSSLSGAIEALKASTLRLPVVGGARADIQNVKDAVGSAVDVMQAMASSICYLLSKVEEVNSLVAELANVTAQERALLDQSKDLLSTLAAMQVKECSLRTHLLQLKRVPATSLTAPV
ncbi:Protein of unknown function DUF566 [Macleaya cordata]|uniref:QWRF family n=1 Tax=Macleaya cordata TaxID=56857 RepID=A0A200QFQ9_MACCD|nr:Protein of unknown function DUF566 [Macleaya cordata]